MSKVIDNDGDVWVWDSDIDKFRCTTGDFLSRTFTEIEEYYGIHSQTDTPGDPMSDTITLPTIPDDVTALKMASGATFTRVGDSWEGWSGQVYGLGELLNMESALTLVRETAYDAAVKYFVANPGVRSNAPNHHLDAIISKIVEENK